MKSIMSAIREDDPSARRLLGGGLQLKELVLRAEMLREAPAEREVIRLLRTANDRLPGDDARLSSIDRLQSGAVVVCAGQQPGLFAGPVMALVKAAAAVRLAETLAQAGAPAVPVFWIASEDHDFAEANRFFLRPTELRPEGGWFALPGRERHDSLHDLIMTKSDRTLLEELAASESIDHSWLPLADETMGNWFARLLATLTTGSGLIIVQPIDFAGALVPLRRAILARHDELVELVSLASQELADADFQTPLSVPEPDNTLLFLATPEGRKRLDHPEPHLFRAGRTELSDRELERIITEEPQRLTSAASARPLAQQALLPVVAQISGPTEGAYMAQLMPLFQALGLPRPLIRPRPQLTFLDQSLVDLRHDLGLTGDPASRGFELSIDPDDTISRLMTGLRSLLQGVENHGDEFLRRELVSYRREVTHRLQALGKDWQRDMKKRDRERARQRHRLGLDLRIDQGGQDRVVAPPALGWKLDGREFHRIVAALADDAMGSLCLEFEDQE